MDIQTLESVNLLVRRLGRAVQFTKIENHEIRFTVYEQQFVADCNLTCIEQVQGSFRVSSNWADIMAKMIGDARNGSV